MVCSKPSISSKMCLTVRTSVFNVLTLGYTTGDQTTAQPTAIRRVKKFHSNFVTKLDIKKYENK